MILGSTADLDELEGQLRKLPPGLTKHDMEAGFDAMALWIRTLRPDRQSQVLNALPVWLRDRSHPWHSRAALEMAVRLRDNHLLDAAVDEAVGQGIHDEIDLSGQYPPWLEFDLGVISAISRWTGDTGIKSKRFLRVLRSTAETSTTYPRRLLAIRAWLTECLLERDSRDDCLVNAMSELREWRDGRLLRSAVTLLHAYFASEEQAVSKIREIVTREEFALGWPEQPDIE